MLENIGLSFQGIWHHKTRSFLTMLGIIIGIAAIITIVSTIQGTNEQIKKNLVGSGTDTVTVQLINSDGWTPDFTYESIPEGISAVDETMISDLVALDGIEAASAYNYRNYPDSVYIGTNSFSGNLYGVDENYLSTAGYDIILGRGFVQADFDNHRKVAVIDTTTMTSYFQGTDPIGQTIEMGGEPFTIVGVASAKTNTSVVISSISDYYTYGGNTTSNMFITDAAWSVIYHYDEPQNVLVKADSTDDMTIAGTNAANYLTSAAVTGTSDYSYQAEDLLSQASELQALASATSQQLIWIAGISLLVGGIGVMNIMLVSVTERTREIGLKKALGARKGVIRLQFLTEAAVLTSLGGVLGVAAGIGAAKIMSRFTGTPSAISVPACLIAVAFSMAIGIIFGLLPAVKASNLNPIDALRRE